MSTPAVKEGYTPLKQGDVIQEGDLYWCDSLNRWVLARQSVSTTVRKNDLFFIRKVETKKEPMNSPNVKEGYALLSSDDVIQEGDTFWSNVANQWILAGASVGSPVSEWSPLVFSRKVEPKVEPLDPQKGPGPDWYIVDVGGTVKAGDVYWETASRGAAYHTWVTAKRVGGTVDGGFHDFYWRKAETSLELWENRQ